MIHTIVVQSNLLEFSRLIPLPLAPEGIKTGLRLSAPGNQEWLNNHFNRDQLVYHSALITDDHV